MDDKQLATEQKEQYEEALTVMNVDRAIKDRIAQVEKLKEEMRTQKEMVDSALSGDIRYSEANEAAKKATKNKSAIKNQILNQPQNASIVATLKEMKEKQKDLEEALSYYLQEYQRLTGANEFEGEDGELRQIVYQAKLIKRSEFKK